MIHFHLPYTDEVSGCPNVRNFDLVLVDLIEADDYEYVLES